MALPKLVKIGGSYYRGYHLIVGANPGEYILDMVINDKCVLNGITIIFDGYGVGDHIKLEHLDIDDKCLATLAENVYNIGSSWSFDFSSLERMEQKEKFRLTYTNVFGIALNVYTNLERIK